MERHDYWLSVEKAIDKENRNRRDIRGDGKEPCRRRGEHDLTANLLDIPRIDGLRYIASAAGVKERQ